MPTHPRTIKDIQSDLRAFDAAARRDQSPTALVEAWRRIFGHAAPPMSAAAAKGFSQYYKTMTRAKKHTTRRRKQRGGAAPLNYVMTPGMPLATWGQFPVEVDTDPGSIKDLDVYFHDSLPLSPPGYWPSVPADMGSNRFVASGGKRRRVRNTRRRQQRGGNLLESLAMRPIFTATAPPNVAQIAANAWAGSPAAIPTPASAVQHTWSPASAAGAPIDPGRITEIGSNFARLAAPAPWASTLPSAPGAATGR